MLSVITKIYNKKTKGPTLMELFTATGKLKKFLFLTTRDARCVHEPHEGIFYFLPFEGYACYFRPYTECFVMFSVIKNIYNKKTKGPALMELFTATGKLKKFLFLTTRDARCVHHG